MRQGNESRVVVTFQTVRMTVPPRRVVTLSGRGTEAPPLLLRQPGYLGAIPRPVALRPSLTTGLPLSERALSPSKATGVPREPCDGTTRKDAGNSMNPAAMASSPTGARGPRGDKVTIASSRILLVCFVWASP